MAAGCAVIASTLVIAPPQHKSANRPIWGWSGHIYDQRPVGARAWRESAAVTATPSQPGEAWCDKEVRVPLVPDDRVRLLCETSLGALLIVDDDRRYVCVNEPATRLLGAPREEIVGRSIEQFTPPEHCPRLEQLSAALRQKGSLEGEYEVLRGNGTRSWVRFRACYGFAAGEHLIAAVEAGRVGGSSTHERVPVLTPRERQVLELASDGRTTPEIAAALVVSRATVKTHLEHIYGKLDAHDRVSAVAKALRLGLIF
jgi:PAS domain S-box-containing protein